MTNLRGKIKQIVSLIIRAAIVHKDRRLDEKLYIVWLVRKGDFGLVRHTRRLEYCSLFAFATRYRTITISFPVRSRKSYAA